MRNQSLLVILFLLLSFKALEAQSFKNASDYLDFIAGEQDEIVKDMWRYTKTVAHGRSDRNIGRRRKNLLKTIDEAIIKIKKADGFGSSDYKSKVLRHMQFNKNLLNQDYAKILDMKEVAEQSYDAMEAYILAQEMADQKMEESQQQYEEDLYTFASANNIEIIENDSDLGNKMKISNEVFGYYSDLYLIYFKVFINEIYLMDALERSDVSAIQQNANALHSAAVKGLTILENQESYNGDKSIIKATQNAFEFFIEESSDKIPQITEFLILNEDFEKIRNTLDQMDERKRTNEQIDNYNKKVKEVNEGIKNYNVVNADLNNKRQIVINKLNQVNAEFLDRHVPND